MVRIISTVFATVLIVANVFAQDLDVGSRYSGHRFDDEAKISGAVTMDVVITGINPAEKNPLVAEVKYGFVAKYPVCNGTFSGKGKNLEDGFLLEVDRNYRPDGKKTQCDGPPLVYRFKRMPNGTTLESKFTRLQLASPPRATGATN